MKAAVIYENGDPAVLRYEDGRDPECRDGWVLIDVEAISIEGGDLLARAGSTPRSVPHIVGYLAAGTVIEVGDGVEDRAVGDRVVTLHPTGSHASNMTAGLDAPRADPHVIARRTADAIIAGDFEVLADDTTRAVKSQLSQDVAALYTKLTVA